MSDGMTLYNYVYDSDQDRKVLKIWREDDSYSGGYWDEATEEETLSFIDYLNSLGSDQFIDLSDKPKRRKKAKS